jgi:serine/threonine protein kinase
LIPVTDKPLNLRALFDAACEIPDEQQAAWLLENCPNGAQRNKLVRLLEARKQSSGPLAIDPKQMLDALAPSAQSSTSTTDGAREIGDFKLIRPVGQGGMATVYLATRSGFDQRVAVKLLHRTVLSDFDRRLFERERRALASLEHANVARLIDGGVTADNQPYLVMEFVDGLPITEFARRRQLSPNARIALLIEVCNAVAAAHAQLIVHRDIKPSNVLVTPAGECKLLDFGVAKLLAEDSELTRQGASGFTPDYAAPEQLTDEAISTATDVYALGALGLELLVGVCKRAQRRSKPSVLALDVRGDDHTIAYTQRALARYLRGDLDNILLKCLHEDPQRRYPGAHALAEDLRCFLDQRPVSAHPPSGWYLARKFAARHRGGVIITSVLSLLTLASLVLALWSANRAHLEVQRAEHALQVSEQVQEFIISIFDEAVPDVPEDQEPSAKALVLAAQERVVSELNDVPEVKLELFRRLVQIQNVVGAPSQALELAAMADEFAVAHFPPGSRARRTAAFDHALLRDMAGEADALNTLTSLATEISASSGDLEDLAQVTSLTGRLTQRGQHAEAHRLLAAVIGKLRPRCESGEAQACQRLGTALNNLSVVYWNERNYEASLPPNVEALALSRQYLGEAHRETAKTLGNLGLLEFYLGQNQKAIDHTSEALSILQKIEGPNASIASYFRQTQANLLADSGRHLEAVAIHQSILGNQVEQNDAADGMSLFRLNYARELVQVGRYDEAEQELLRLRPGWEKNHEGNLQHLARWHETLAVIHAERDQNTELALAGIKESLAIRAEQQPEPKVEVLMSLMTALRIASRDPAYQARAADLYADIEQRYAVVEHPLLSLQRNHLLQQAEYELNSNNLGAATRHLKQLWQLLGDERPNGTADWARLIELKIEAAGHPGLAPDPTWIGDLRQRWGDDARIVKEARSLSQGSGAAAGTGKPQT